MQILTLHRRDREVLSDRHSTGSRHISNLFSQSQGLETYPNDIDPFIDFVFRSPDTWSNWILSFTKNPAVALPSP